MPEQINKAILEIQDSLGRNRGKITLVPTLTNRTSNVYPLVEAAPDEMHLWGEERIQLLENCRYEYTVESNDNLQLNNIYPYVVASILNKNSGYIEPGSNVGLFTIQVVDEIATTVCTIGLEVRSQKLEYREHYRTMLEDISEKCTSLLLQLNAPSLGSFKPRQDLSSTTIAQQFYFLKHIVSTLEFRGALNRIISNPHFSIKNLDKNQPTNRGFKPTPKVIRQLVNRNPRVTIPPNHFLNSRLKTIPSNIDINFTHEIVDTSENRVIKHILLTFSYLLQDIQKKLRLKKTRIYSDEKLIIEIESLINFFQSYLSHNLFKEISDPKSINIGSPVLQRKPGYREILKTWMKFNVGIQLSWQGGDDVFAGGKRNVAMLYEYWVFFQLIDSLVHVFRITPPKTSDLIEYTSDGFGLKLKAGKTLILSGTTIIRKRPLNIKFAYNRVFNRIGNSSIEINYPNGGSWTKTMRPDYTLSFWPAEMEEELAEKNELITHIHLDAKYKIHFELLEEDRESEIKNSYDNGNNSTQKIEKFEKREDLLTLHAYRDAIRRTEAAYIIYPGDRNCKWSCFRELLPGIGAFSLRPENRSQGISEFEFFLNAVAEQLANRASENKRIKFYTHQTLSSEPGEVNLDYPEFIDIFKRTPPPQDHYILIADFTDAAQFQWVKLKNILPLPLKDESINPNLFRLTHIVLRYKNSTTELHLPKTGGPHICKGDSQHLIDYPEKDENEIYLCLELNPDDRFQKILDVIPLQTKADAQYFEVHSLKSLTSK